MNGKDLYLVMFLISTTLASCNSEAKVEQVAVVPQSSMMADSAQVTTAPNRNNTSLTFSWSTESCTNKGIYNPEDYTEQQLKDTYYLWYKFNSVIELEDATLDNPDELTIENINKKSQKLDSDYNKATNRLKNLKLVPGQFWNTLRDLKTKNLDELYALKKLTIEAYRTPVILVNNSYSQKCQVYVNALASEDSVELINAWESLVEEKMKNNGAPELLKAKFNKQRHCSEWLRYAKIELMTYGWWNCANHQRKYIDAYQNMPMEEEFNKLFIKITEECDVD
ncbi:hypothetical protein GU926_10970 [Nibribacter ruber]|uniref:Uncharacterized protein n=1 Tax=Nibribacter ruber TaxID=2698458 RepID=A0A6P1P1M7_9BACT|nr:hypothetical protein [Nibribacter ruber]QHL87923.1 hypothetical protein GU926_10970 [Nibribacter ruber]